MLEEEEYDDDLGNIPYMDGGTVLKDGALAASEGDGDLKVNSVIPYMSVYNPPRSMKEDTSNIFMTDVPILVLFKKYERNGTKHPLNPYLYTFDITHGRFTWQIHKRYKHFLYLHQQLKLYHATLPFKRSRQSFKDNAERRVDRGSLPRFPNKPEVMIGYDEVDDRSQQLEQYLQNLLNISFYKSHSETVQFLGVSYLSFVNDLGIKGIEVMVKKQTGSKQRGCCGLFDCFFCLKCGQVLSDLCGCWRPRWLVVKDTCLVYIRPRDAAIRGVLLFDQSFDVSSGHLSSGIQVYNSQRRIMFKCRGRRKRANIVKMIKDVIDLQGHGFQNQNKNSSFAPQRSFTTSRWYVDGSSYMSAVADAIIGAKEEIFIADWWLSPEIYLKRPSLYGDQWRLDCVLKRKACEGVKIYVLLYKEVELALGINSYYSKVRLAKCHSENMKILRHPDRASSGVYLWAHHEKIVCVDQTYAFLGGLDLCYGRWDDHEHRLIDHGGYISDNPHKKTITSSRPLGAGPRPLATLIQTSNNIGLSTVTGYGNGEKIAEAEVYVEGATELEAVMEEISLDTTDVDGEMMAEPTEENMKGDSPEFQRKSIFRKLQDSVQESSKTFLNMMTGEGDELDKKNESAEKPVDEELEQSKQITEVEGLKFLDECDGGFIRKGIKYWIGKDYCNFIVKDFHDLDSPYADLVDRNTTPRMPWHDVGMMVHGAAARDVARHFIQRWNATKVEKAKKVQSYPYLLPKSYENFEQLPDDGGKYYQVNCQVLRSVSAWSAGFIDPDIWEESIHEAYSMTISKAQHYVYIENQFFISLARQNPHVKNQIGEAICKRILKAHKEGKKFRVYVILPLLPGFEGEVGGPSGTALHAITHWNYASMCRGKNSLIGRLLQEGVENPENYISFHGLRNHSVLRNGPVTELIYVHSKLMIVDDKYVICGSANINDRSMIGKRDSEIAILNQDEDFDDGVMNGEQVPVGKFASSLRKRLFSEHLGLLNPSAAPIDIEDPVSDDFYHGVWRATSSENTQIYEDVFRCLPSDRVTNFKELKSYNEEIPLLSIDPATANIKISNIKGFLVDMPLNFLKDATLTPDPKSVEGMMPTSLWT